MDHGFSIELADEAQLPSLRDLFTRMYAHFNTSNGITTLSAAGFDRWCRNYDRSKLVTRAIYIAFEKSEPVAFIEGQIRLAPIVAEPGKIGHVAHLYVADDFRKHGLASDLYQNLLNWFATKETIAQTLEVVAANAEGEGFWRSKGFQPTFVSYIKE